MRERPFYILGDNLSVKQLLQAHGEDVVYRSSRSWLVKTNLTALAIILPCALFIFIFGVIHDRGISDKACYMAPIPLVILPFIWVTSFWCEFWRPRKQASVGKQLMSVYYPDAVIKSDCHPDQIYFESDGQEIRLNCRRYTKETKLGHKTYCFYSFDMLFVPEVYLDERWCKAYDYSAMLKDVHSYLEGKTYRSVLGVSENMVGVIVDPRKPIGKDDFDSLMSERDYVMKRFKLKLVSEEEYSRVVKNLKERMKKNCHTETQ